MTNTKTGGSRESQTSATQDKIARLAYQYWEERGRPLGSSQEDWFRAEKQLRSAETVARTPVGRSRIPSREQSRLRTQQA